MIFDWGGTLTPWHPIDFPAEAAALALAATGDHPDPASALLDAGGVVWGRSRDQQVSATVADLFAEAGLGHDADLLTAYREFWEPHTITDPDVGPLLRALHDDGLRVGVLSNTVWPRAWHDAFLARDGVLDLIDGAVYTSEIPWTKPAPEAFRAAMAAVGVDQPGACVFVGDRLFDDIWGAATVGMRTIHIPNSTIPPEQLGHSQGEPDAVVRRIGDVYDVVSRWRAVG
ncbi:MAG: HAD family hydrolase [Nocardioidaceae bacterium]